MRVYDNGIYRDMTAREKEENNNVPDVAISKTDTERIEELEQTVAQLNEQLDAAKIILGVE